MIFIDNNVYYQNRSQFLSSLFLFLLWVRTRDELGLLFIEPGSPRLNITGLLVWYYFVIFHNQFESWIAFDSVLGAQGAFHLCAIDLGNGDYDRGKGYLFSRLLSLRIGARVRLFSCSVRTRGRRILRTDSRIFISLCRKCVRSA